MEPAQLVHGAHLADYLFPDGLPPAAIEAWAGETVSLIELSGDQLGATKATTPSMPPLPNAKDPAACRAYLASVWKVIATLQGTYKVKSDAELTFKRLSSVPVAKSPQAMIADLVAAGPLRTAKGADRWYTVAQHLQAYVTQRTGEASVSSAAGSVAAAGLAHAADRVKAAAKSGKAKDPARLADLADKLSARALEAVKSVASVPGQVTDRIAAVPEHLAASVKDAAQHAIESAEAAAPGILAGVKDTVFQGFAGAGTGLAIGVAIIGGIATAAATAYFAPELTTVYVASKGGKTSYTGR